MVIPVIRILSLGAGVQSSTLALMAACGEIEPAPDAAIFADTGDEPISVYRHLSWLMSPNVLPFPVHVVRPYKPLSVALMCGDESARIPFFVGAGGMGMRQCTRNWKLRPIRRMTRQILGKMAKDYIAPGSVESWIGISTDESLRVKQNAVQFVINRYPLIELGMSRNDCEEWLVKKGYPLPPKSSCVFCPFKNNDQWGQMKAGDPVSWDKAVAMDYWLREPPQVHRFHGRLYIHKSRVALADVPFPLKRQCKVDNFFNNECEGLCGV